MLLPFSQKLLVLPKIHPEFAQTIFADLQRIEPGFEGYLQVVDDHRSLIFLACSGEILYHALYSKHEGRLVPQCCAPAQNLSLLGTDGAMLVLGGDHLATAVNAVLLTRTPDMIIPAGRANLDMVLEEALARSDLFVVNIVCNHIARPAVFSQGELTQWYDFDEETKTYSVTADQQALAQRITQLPHHAHLAVYCDPRPTPAAGKGWGGPDPFQRVIEKYFLLCNLIRDLLIHADRSRAVEEISQVLAAFKKKYLPLYKGIYINPESLAVNWEQLLENRLRVSAKFRYEMFFLYLDELLLALIKKLYELTRREGIRALVQQLERMRAMDPEAESSHLIRLFFTKLDNLLKSK